MRKFFSFFAALLFAGSMMAETYTKTAYADLQSGDVVIITMQKGTDVFAASNDKGTGAAPVATAVTVADNAITTDATNILWTVVKDGDNISFQAGEAYLYCTNSNNGVRVGSGEAKVFSIDATSGYLYNNGTSRYIGVYNSQDFRCYTSVNSSIQGQTLAFYAVSGTPVVGQPKYYVAGSMNEWKANANYKLSANPAVDGEYMGEFTFAANDEFKVIMDNGSADYTWYPEGMGNNWVVNQDGDYMVYFRPAGNTEWANGFFNVIMKEKPVIPTYNVAEAIAAGLTDNTEINVRGIITKMEFKGKNFAQYGSVNIYVADATGAEGTFEFYNCYSLNADTFKTSTPAYDATSTAYAEFTEVADANGNAIHIGDTVIAFGKYKLYNTTHELNTGCNLIEIKHKSDTPQPVGVETIYDWAGEIGTTIFGGNSNITTGTVKIHENTDDVNGIKFGSSYVYADGKWIAIKAKEGGFKAGDVLSVSVVFNNSDVTKYCMADVYAADQTTRLFRSDSASTLNGRNAGEPIVQTYTLEADQDSLLLGRYGNTGMFVTLLKVTRALVPEPTTNYYVCGTMTDWKVNANYMLTPSNDGEYMGEFTFAANNELKIVSSQDGATIIDWFPTGMGNNYQINEEGDYKIFFNPAGNVPDWYEGYFNVIMKEKPVIAQYEVAEAIAAGLTDNTEIQVRGIITKMEFKGKNFAKFGSVNIYVADATGAEGEFEFFNCYSLNADTFKTSTPNYDAESTAWAQFTEVADANGNAIHVGDTVIAQGKYKLYNTTYELNTGCYLIDIKHAPVQPADTITLAMNNGYVSNEYYEYYGSTDVVMFNIPVVDGSLVGDGDYLDISIFPEDPNDITGTYTVENEALDIEYTWLMQVAGTDTTEVEFVDGNVVIAIENAQKTEYTAELKLTGSLTSVDGDVYLVNFDMVVYYDFLNEEQGIEDVAEEPKKVIKRIEMGKVVIEKNGKVYNAAGTLIR